MAQVSSPVAASNDLKNNSSQLDVKPASLGALGPKAGLDKLIGISIIVIMSIPWALNLAGEFLADILVQH